MPSSEALSTTYLYLKTAAVKLKSTAYKYSSVSRQAFLRQTREPAHAPSRRLNWLFDLSNDFTANKTDRRVNLAWRESYFLFISPFNSGIF